MSHLARDERLALCDTFERVGPGAPTLCDPWDTAGLAGHLVIRDRRPDLAVGVVLPPLAPRLAAGQEDYARQPWPQLVDLVRSGPPGWSPARLPAVDDAVNLGELFIHHEDVLRAPSAAESPMPRPRREVGPETEAALWAALRRTGKLLFRKARTGVVLVAPGHGRYAAKGPTDLGTVVLEGSPGELLLSAFGRIRVADVEAVGAPEAVSALRASTLGFG